MVKLVFTSILSLVSIAFMAQDCSIVCNETIAFDSISNNYSPIIQSANCEWKKYELNVYNRWGNTIYTSKAINDIWDVADLKSGTFYYVLKATSFSKETIQQKGYINLIK